MHSVEIDPLTPECALQSHSCTTAGGGAKTEPPVCAACKLTNPQPRVQPSRTLLIKPGQQQCVTCNMRQGTFFKTVRVGQVSGCVVWSLVSGGGVWSLVSGGGVWSLSLIHI